VSWTPHTHPVTAWSAAFTQPPVDARWSTVWIWLILFLPEVSTVASLLTGGGDPRLGTTERSSASTLTYSSLFPSPLALLLNLLSWIIIAAVVFFAYRDHAQLTRRGIEKPFHWAWAFLSVVYPIGRAVVVTRRIGRGSIVMWIAIGTLVVNLIMTSALIAQIMSQSLATVSSI
jgi:hypothetical protein